MVVDIEKTISEGFFSKPGVEKTFIDKLLAKEDTNAIRELIKKPKLTRSELLEVLYLLSATEAKLVNYGSWDRYVILKFFVWIREFIKIAELLFDYEDRLAEQEKAGKYKVTDRTRRLLDNNSRLIQHNAKFLIDLYLNIARTSLSLGASGFTEMLKQKFEIDYKQPNIHVQNQDMNQNTIRRS